MSEPDVTQIVAGAGILFVAPMGTALPAIDEQIPPAPVLGSTVLGALGARTVFARITGVINGVESGASAELSLAVLANSVLTVASPVVGFGTDPDAQWDHYNVYLGATAGSEKLQAGGPVLIGTQYTEPATGFITSGVVFPTTIGTGEFPVTWPAAWKQVGYTDKGIDFTYTPSVKDINVDEEMAPVSKILTSEKATISSTLAEVTLLNLQRAISASIFTDDTATAKSISLKAGSGNLNYVMVGVQGPAPGTGVARIIILYKAISQAAVKITMQRTDKVSIPVQFDGVADSNKPIGKRVFEIVDITAGAN